MLSDTKKNDNKLFDKNKEKDNIEVDIKSGEWCEGFEIIWKLITKGCFSIV